MNWYIEVLKKYAEFSGRASREEYWIFFMISFIIMIALAVIGVMVGASGIIVNLYSLAVLIPSTAVGIRRMHDTDHSGWWILLPIINIILAASDGTKGCNRFGPDPKETAHNINL